MAAVVFLGVVALAGAAFLGFSFYEQDSEESAATDEDAPASGQAEAGEATPAAAGAAVDAEAAELDAASAGAAASPLSLDAIAWTTEAPTTLEELSGTWSIPRDVLVGLNPDLSPQDQLAVGTKVTVYADTLGQSYAIGPPNDGKLIRGVPLPENAAWTLPDDRGRAFATAATIARLTAGLEAYAAQFPQADPVDIGDLSARRGGQIYGHQSHQNGLDVDIRLVLDSTGESFDAERNWFLVKSLVDAGNVRAIFLNAREQTWLREAAESDVGAESVQDYFAFISHEPGHTIHMHIRFACPDGQGRCVSFSQPDTAEQDGKTKKLPTKLPRPGAKPGRGSTKLPGGKPKGSGGTKKKKGKKPKPKKKKKKK